MPYNLDFCVHILQCISRFNGHYQLPLSKNNLKANICTNFSVKDKIIENWRMINYYNCEIPTLEAWIYKRHYDSIVKALR